MMFSSTKYNMANSMTPSSLFSTYASLTASMLLVRTLANDLFPAALRAYLFDALRRLFNVGTTSYNTFIIEEYTNSHMARNQAFEAAEVYLSTQIYSQTDRQKINMAPTAKGITYHLEKDEKLVDFFDGVDLKWRFICTDMKANNRAYSSGGNPGPGGTMRSFELTFEKKHKDKIANSYIPFIIKKAKETEDKEKVLKMFTLNDRGYSGKYWESINLDHPSTFHTLAMEPEQKKSVVEDLNMFLKRKEFYKRVGRAWKRGYLLYGPPGTGKSSMVAAMANYLKFDVYDLQLSNVTRESDLRKILLETANRSILVIEDIDCSVDLTESRDSATANRANKAEVYASPYKLTLSGLLNFIDGLWSTCGDERIIIFTTNHVEKLDPALLRPGRMDMHIHMSYCTFNVFKILASNYLQVSPSNPHHLFPEIETLISDTNVTPAEVAEELMKGDVDVALAGVVKLLKRKRMKAAEGSEEELEV